MSTPQPAAFVAPTPEAVAAKRQAYQRAVRRSQAYAIVCAVGIACVLVFASHQAEFSLVAVCLAVGFSLAGILYFILSTVYEMLLEHLTFTHGTGETAPAGNAAPAQT